MLREALLALRTRRRPDGGLDLQGDLPPELREPYARAVARIADDVAAEDAAAGRPAREKPHLLADALMALVLRLPG